MNPTWKRYIEKSILILLFILTLHSIVFFILRFSYPSWIQYGFTPDTFAISNTIQWVLWILSILVSAIGFIQLLFKRQWRLINTFRFPLLYILFKSVFFRLISTLLSTKLTYSLVSDQYWYYNFVQIADFILCILVVLWFIGQLKEQDVQGAPVSKGKRLTHYLVDSIIIISYTFSRIQVFQAGYVLEDYALFNTNPYWVFFFYIFTYYLVLEFFGLQTVGKVITGSRVTYSGNRFRSILIRTLCRFIPFENLSFFGKEGWHDRISGTEVKSVK